MTWQGQSQAPTKACYLIVKFVFSLQCAAILQSLAAIAVKGLQSLAAIAVKEVQKAGLINRYYADKIRIGNFCGKISNQIISSCKAHIVRNGKLWDQHARDVLASLDAIAQVQASYVQIFRYAASILPAQYHSIVTAYVHFQLCKQHDV